MRKIILGLVLALLLSSNAYARCIKGNCNNGQGIYTWLNENKYVGNYKDGKRDGQGTFTWPDGRKYIGEFKDNLRNGQGTFTSSYGNKYFGEWNQIRREISCKRMGFQEGTLALRNCKNKQTF